MTLSYLEWLETILKDCPRALDIRGGSFCKFPDGKRGYCTFRYCPRREDLVKNGV